VVCSTASHSGRGTPEGEIGREWAIIHDKMHMLACILCKVLVQLELRRELMQDDAVPASPNLDSLVKHRPACKRALVRLLWPKIRASLEIGHTLREVLEKLRLDGIDVSYPSLCRYVAAFRRSDLTEGEHRPALPKQEKPPAASVQRRPRDPLENVRRLTEEKPPGFRYPGTMSDKELFGDESSNG
jgi:hypothetical protein